MRRPMLDPEERALVTDLKDKIIDLLVQKHDARSAGNEALAANLQRKIDRLCTECGDIRRSAGG